MYSYLAYASARVRKSFGCRRIRLNLELLLQLRLWLHLLMLHQWLHLRMHLGRRVRRWGWQHRVGLSAVPSVQCRMILLEI